jgi:eukaryotic-like serine/threonine-protein kinase
VFYALDAQTGKVRWTYDIKTDGNQTSFHGDPIFAGDLILIGTDGDDIGRLYAFEKATGKVRWKYASHSNAMGRAGVNTDIVLLGSRVYAIALGDELVCLDLASGTLQWKFRSGFGSEKFAWSNTPAAADGRVFFGGLDGTVYALDADSGAVRWKKDLGSPIATSVTLDGDSLFVGAANGHLYRLSQLTGEMKTDFNAGENLHGTLVLTGAALLVFRNWMVRDSEILAVDRSLQKILWRAKPPENSSWTSARPYVWGAELIAGNDAGVLSAFRLADGSLAWTHTFSGILRGVGYSDGVYYVGTLDGGLYAYRREKGKASAAP